MFKNLEKAYKTSIILVCWAILVIIIIFLLKYFRDLLSIMVISAIITYVMLWPSNALEKILPDTKRVSKRFIAALTTYIASIIILVVLASLMAQPVSKQIIELSQALPKYIVELEQKSVDYIDNLSSQYGIDMVENLMGTSPGIKEEENVENLSSADKRKVHEAIVEEKFYQQLQVLANHGAQALQDVLLGTVRNLIYVVLIIMLSFFLLISANDLHTWIENFFREKHFEKFREIEKRIHQAIFGYIRGQAIIGFVTGLFMWGIYEIFDLKYSLVLALLMGLGQFIPFVGQTLAIIPAIIVALVADPLSAMVLLGVFLVFQVFSNNVLVPKILGDMTGLNPIIVILAMIIGERVAGILGILLAVPIASIIQILITSLKPQLISQETIAEAINGSNKTIN